MNVAAIDFLLKHNFRIDGPFLEGVPYFSRAEEAAARQLDAEQKRTHLTDIRIRDAEAESFMRRVRQEVFNWKNRLLVSLSLSSRLTCLPVSLADA